jgi:hypothetical protein
MDHHCPWTVNCVGAHNHAHFIRFLVYTVLADLTVLGFLVKRIYAIYLIWNMSSNHGPSTKELVFLLLTTFSAFMTGILVGILAGYQIWSVIENTTTIEALEKQRVETWVEKHDAEQIEFPYNTTLSSNLAIVFGSDIPLLWLWPWNRTTHDGLNYPIVEDADLPWPPPQTIPSQDLAPPTAELPWSSGSRSSGSRSTSASHVKHHAVSRLRRPPPQDEESGESEIDSDDESEHEFFDDWFGLEEMEDYGVDIDSEVRGLRKEEEGVMWEEVLRRRREGSP